MSTHTSPLSPDTETRSQQILYAEIASKAEARRDTAAKHCSKSAVATRSRQQRSSSSRLLTHLSLPPPPPVRPLTSAVILFDSISASLSSLALACNISPTCSLRLSTYCFLRMRVFLACSRFLTLRNRKRNVWTGAGGREKRGLVEDCPHCRSGGWLIG